MAKQPNLIFVFPDQMRGSSLGFLNKEPVKTPVLDAFAKESHVSLETVSNYPVCSPYRAMLMTGQYPVSNGVVCNCNNKTAPFGIELNKDTTCWSDVLKSNEYETAYIGKWHLDAPYSPYIDCANNSGEIKWNEWCPKDRRHGFDYWYSYGTYDYHTKPMYWDTESEREEFHFVNEWGPSHEANQAIKYIENSDSNSRDPNKPFAMVVSMNPPHTPYELVPQKYKDLYKDLDIETLANDPRVPQKGTNNGDLFRNSIANYYAMISGVDEQFGRILTALDKSGLKENTIVIFTSDHGDCIGMHDQPHKPAPYEEAFQVPFLIRWPNQIPARQSQSLISTPDLHPTILGLLGYSDQIPSTVEGNDISNHLKSNEEVYDESQLFYWVNKDWPNKESHKPTGGSRGIRNKRYTLVHHLEKNSLKSILYDRINDPHQLDNIVSKKQKEVDELNKILIKKMENVGDQWSGIPLLE